MSVRDPPEASPRCPSMEEIPREPSKAGASCQPRPRGFCFLGFWIVVELAVSTPALSRFAAEASCAALRAALRRRTRQRAVPLGRRRRRRPNRCRKGPNGVLQGRPVHSVRKVLLQRRGKDRHDVAVPRVQGRLGDRHPEQPRDTRLLQEELRFLHVDLRLEPKGQRLSVGRHLDGLQDPRALVRGVLLAPRDDEGGDRPGLPDGRKGA
mmetsp:Transcript_20277/g.42170  ORF Transcript_20277/g.42170 Transcript_20277/m.42170 type:complete len:209 (+) Transcript_20277:1627-2253(+)